MHSAFQKNKGFLRLQFNDGVVDSLNRWNILTEDPAKVFAGTFVFSNPESGQFLWFSAVSCGRIVVGIVALGAVLRILAQVGSWHL